MLDIPYRVGRALLTAGRDRLTRTSDVPRQPADLTPLWFSRALGTNVTSVERIATTTGTTVHGRVRLGGERVPASVFVKLAPTAPATRIFVDLMGLGSTEVRFYREIRGELPVDAPAVFASALDGRTGRFALVLEDLATRGCRFGDVRGTASPDEAAEVVAALARLHAHFRQSPRFRGDLAWLFSHADDPNAAVVGPLLRAALRRVSRIGPVPAGARFLIERHADVERALAGGPSTLLHGDPHLGNLYFDGAVPGFLDWQVVRKGSGLRDVVYFMVLSMDTELRRAHQDDLVKLYLKELAGHGGDALDPNEAWRRLRALASYPWVAAVFTAGAGGLQAREIAAAGLARASEALDDLEVPRAVRDLLG